MKTLRSIGWATALLGMIAILWTVPIGSQARMTCGICRVSRFENHYLIIPWSYSQETPCSRWYAEHVEPTHPHLWARSSCRTITNLLGIGVGVACGRPPHIWLLSPEIQMRFYQHFDDPWVAKAILLPLATKTHADAPDYASQEAEKSRVADAILEWSLHRFAGRWEDWWAKYQLSHPLPE